MKLLPFGPACLQHPAAALRTLSLLATGGWLLATPLLRAHSGGHARPELEAMIAGWRAAQVATTGVTPGVEAAPAAGYGETMASSFGVFRPRVRSYFDATTFYVEADNVPDPALMPAPMVGITSWQQQIPLPTSYFASTTNPERDSGSIGFGKPNVWRLPLVPTPAANPIPISAGNFQRGAIAVAADGIAIFNPRNNTGRVSYEIGELDSYGGHCGLADDYHYHLAPVHLQVVTGVDKPIAWALDGYPIYGYSEPDGSPRLPLDADGGHSHGAWSYHYHAIGSATAGPQSPYLPTAFHGTVINYGGQVDGQPEVQAIRQNNTGGYTAQAVQGARIVAFKHPVALATDAAGHLSESATGTPSPDAYLMRVQIGGTTYDECWRINRSTNPKTLTVTWRLPTVPATTTTYNNSGSRLTTYGMAAASLRKIPDTGQTIDVAGVTGEDADYTINPPAYTDHGNGTVTDNVTGLMWQKIDAGESSWESAVARATAIDTGGYTDWRLPTPGELFSLMNHNNGNPAAMNTTFFPVNPTGTAEYWWTSDIYGADATKVWCVNSGGGLGPKPKAETTSAGGTLRYHARYVRGARPSNGHNYRNNLDGTITDLDSGLMWTQVPASARSWSAAVAYAEELNLAGYDDWRLPNIKELQSLTDYTLATSTNANTALAPLNRVLFPTATTPATAYWSSTVLRSGGGAAPASAWLMELGVATNIPAARGPARGAQGIISYEVMGSSYPVFAVRGPSVAAPPGGGATGDAWLVNLSTRAPVGGVAGTPVTGFVFTGLERPIVIRGVGPTLADFGVSEFMADPRLSVVSGGVTIAGNEDWAAADLAAMAAVGAFPLRAGSRDAALVMRLPPGGYSVPISGPAGASGIAMMEVYDAGAAKTGGIVNASALGYVGAGESVLITGFVVGGTGNLRVLIRAIGPGLVPHGVENPLADPTLTIVRDGVALATNDNWSLASNAPEVAAAAAGAGAFALAGGSRDAALLVTLAPGLYSAVTSGVGGATGTALVEFYLLR
jgi:hypothetical protein